jgi:hypothetical protein
MLVKGIEDRELESTSDRTVVILLSPNLYFCEVFRTFWGASVRLPLVQNVLADLGFVFQTSRSNNNHINT